jgi:hypothetical protein
LEALVALMITLSRYSHAWAARVCRSNEAQSHEARQLVGLLGGAAAVPFFRSSPTRAQQPDRIRRIGVVMPLSQDDLESRARSDALQQGLTQSG